MAIDKDSPLTNNPIQRNAVSFKERPKLTKNKSFRTKTFKVLNISGAEQPKIDIPIKSTNCQDDEDDFGPRAESDDSDDDYDGVPRTYDIPVIHPIKPLNSYKIDNSMDKNENSIDQEILDLP